MSNKKIYTILIVLFILLLGLSSLHATENTTTSIHDTTDHEQLTDTITKNNPTNPDTTPQTTTATRESDVNKTRNIDKKDNSAYKSAPRRENITLYTDNITAQQGDVVRINLRTQPEDVRDGIVTWFIDSQPEGLHNISYDPPYLDYNTSDLTPGEHNIYIDYGVSSTYLEASVEAKLTINKQITINSDKTSITTSVNSCNKTITLTTNDDYAEGKMELYIDSTLKKTYENINYNNYNILLDDEIIRSIPIGNHNWKLVFTPHNTYVRADDITGTLTVTKTRIIMETEDVVCNYGDTVLLNVSFYEEDTHMPVDMVDGVIMYYVDDMIVRTHNQSYTGTECYYDTSELYPGVYEIKYQYVASRLYEDTEATKNITLNHILNVSSDKKTLSYVLRSGVSDDLTLQSSDSYAFGDMDLYIDNSLVKSYSDIDYDNYILRIENSFFNPEEYGVHNWRLVFNPYYDTVKINNLTGLIIAGVKLETVNVTASRGDKINLNFTISPSVNDGIITWIIGEDTVGTYNLSKTSGYLVDFDTSDYLPGTYEILLDYGDSSFYDDANTRANLTVTDYVSITSTDTSLVNGIYNVYSSNVTISCNDSAANGDVCLYVDDVLVETYTDVMWNNLNVSIPDIKIINSYPVVPDYFNHAGNYTWKLEFKDNNGYIADTNITGTLEMRDYVEVVLTDEEIVCYPYDTVEVNFTTTPDNILGGLTFYINYPNYYILDAGAIRLPKNSLPLLMDFHPGTYNLSTICEINTATDNYFERYGINPNYKYHSYPASKVSNTVPIRILKIPLTLESMNTTFNEDNNLYFTMEFSSLDETFEEYHDGTLYVYYEDTLLKTLDLSMFNDESDIPTTINFTLDKKYNNKSLRFECMIRIMMILCLNV